jgi:hypothetical protein
VAVSYKKGELDSLLTVPYLNRRLSITVKLLLIFADLLSMFGRQPVDPPNPLFLFEMMRCCSGGQGPRTSFIENAEKNDGQCDILAPEDTVKTYGFLASFELFLSLQLRLLFCRHTVAIKYSEDHYHF